MSITDPIADYLTRIRNATQTRHSKVDIPASNMIKEMTRILMEEGYIRNFTMADDPRHKQGIVRIYLKYDPERTSIIKGLKRVSRPGYRQYTKADDIPRVMNGLGIVILSTPMGVLTDKQARKQRVGGEVLCYVW
jgi:small subunit ribosomal protein S8